MERLPQCTDRKVRGSSKSSARRLNLKTAASLVRQMVTETQEEEFVRDGEGCSSGIKRKRDFSLDNETDSGLLENETQDGPATDIDICTKVDNSFKQVYVLLL